MRSRVSLDTRTNSIARSRRIAPARRVALALALTLALLAAAAAAQEQPEKPGRPGVEAIGKLRERIGATKPGVGQQPGRPGARTPPISPTAAGGIARPEPRPGTMPPIASPGALAAPPVPSTGPPQEGLPGEYEFNECTKIPAGKKIRITLKPDADLNDLIEWISSMTCKKFIIGSQVRSQKVTIISPEPVTAAEAYHAFISALEVMGLTIEPSGAYLKIIEAQQGKTSPVPTYGPDDEAPADDRIITRLVRLENVAVQDVQPILQTLKSRHGDIQVYAATNTLIVTETGSNMRRLEKILKELDVPGMGEKVWILRVQYASAQEIAEKLKEIFQAQTGPGGRPATPRATPGKGAAKSAGGDESFIEAAPSKIIPDERTNVLIVVASEKAYVRIAALVKKLDISIEGGEGRIHVYPLENADAEELSQTLSGLVQGAAPPGGRKREGAPGGAGGPSGAVMLFEGDVKISADKPTNSLVVVASVKDFYALREVVRKLDIPRRQVFVEATILEVSLDTFRKIGVSWHGAGVAGSGDSQTLIYGGNNAGQTLGPPDPSVLVGLAAGARGPVVEGSGEMLGTGIDIPAFGVLLQAMQTNNDVNVISAPHILTTDNVQAEITVGENVPFQGALLGGGLGGLGGLAGLAGQAGAQGQAGGLGGLGGLLGGVSVQRQDVALTLKLTPHVNDSDFCRLEIEQEVSDIVAENFNGLGPKTSKRQTKTEVVVRDQQTIVIGGLIKNRESITEQKVPLLGDIPILGWLFKSRQRTVVKSNLLLVLTPYVIRDAQDLRRIYEKKLHERRDFIERYTAFADYDPEAEIDYRHKRGLLEEINRTAIAAAEEAAQVREAMRETMMVEEGPVELPPGFRPAPETAPGAAGPHPAQPSESQPTPMPPIVPPHPQGTPR